MTVKRNAQLWMYRASEEDLQRKLESMPLKNQSRQKEGFRKKAAKKVQVSKGSKTPMGMQSALIQSSHCKLE